MSGVYKIIAKVLENKLKIVWEKIVSKTRNAFIRGRQILDLVLIANECLDSQFKSSEPGVLRKLDLEKVYDHVSWDFILCILRRNGFGEKQRN